MTAGDGGTLIGLEGVHQDCGDIVVPRDLDRAVRELITLRGPGGSGNTMVLRTVAD